MNTPKDRLEPMIKICEKTGMTLDEVYEATNHMSEKTFRMFSDNPSSLPRKIKSSVSP